MDKSTIIIYIITLIIAVVMPYLMYKLQDKGSQSAFDMIKLLLNVSKDLTNNTNFDKKELVQLIIDYAQQAVNYAEQLYRAKQITADERKEKAVEYVHNALSVANIKIENQTLVDTIIDNTIEAAVRTLPKTH